MTRTNKELVLKFMEDHGSVRLSVLEEELVRRPTKSKISKETLYRALKALEESKKIVRKEVPNGKKRPKVFYELPTTDLLLQVKSFIEGYIHEYNNNPSLEDIGIAVGKSPSEVEPSVYAVAREVGWRKPLKEFVGQRFGGRREELDKKEIRYILKMLEDKTTEDTAAHYLHLKSSQQPLIKYPSFLRIITKKIVETNSEQTLASLINMIYYVFISQEFKDIESDQKIEGYEDLLDALFSLVKKQDSKERVKDEALFLLGFRDDTRIIPILIDSLNQAQLVQGDETYPFKHVFSRYNLGKFYKKHKTELIEALPKLSKTNKKGANILIGLMNMDTSWES